MFKVLTSGQLSNDKYVRKLENKIKDIYNVKYCIATNSCTFGLMLCLKYLNASYIQVPAFSWYSDLFTLQFLDINIIWVDISLETWLMNEVFNDYSLYIHTFGNIGISKRKDTIYDASQCLGANIPEIGLATVFSLAPSKLITSCEGGIIITNNSGLYTQVRVWRDKMGRLSEPNAIIGLETLKYLYKILDWKKKVFDFYEKNISGQFQKTDISHNHNIIAFINTENLFIPKNIEIRKYYEPLEGGFKNSDYIYKNIICLPSWYGVNYKKIVELIKEANK